MSKNIPQMDRLFYGDGEYVRADEAVRRVSALSAERNALRNEVTKLEGERIELLAAAQADYEARILACLEPPTVAEAARVLTLADLQRAHIERQEEWCPDQKPDLSFRGNELGGECGEAQNVIKKLERERHGWRGSRDTV